MKLLNNIKIISGGAQGADLFWEECARKNGILYCNHITPKDYDALSNTNKDVLETLYFNVCKRLNRPTTSRQQFPGKLVRRDLMQSSASDKTFAVTTLINPGEQCDKGFRNKTAKIQPSGGTGYAVTASILSKQPVYLFNQSDSGGNPVGWYVYDYVIDEFKPTCDTVVLSERPCCIGSRNLTEEGKNAIIETCKSTLEYYNENKK